ncbi:MAG: fatty acid--CoA ligase [Campylobacteraceae bacterium]|jgi:fatty-acyl-CoA synthase|nr:fatty acid--CoA ligase [Campylobacteraceae bacterium]
MSDLTPASNHFKQQLLIKNLLFTPIAKNDEQEIVYKNNFRMSYKEFKKRVNKLANLLTKMGVKEGDTVAIMDYDSHRYLECYFAVPMIGAVLHMINIRLSHEQILYTIDHAQDDVLFINSDFIPIIEQIKGRIDTINNYVLIADENEDIKSKTIPFLGEYEELLKEQSDEFTFLDFDENTRATTFYTTGTTGMPKGVYFSHRQLVMHTLGSLITLSTHQNQGNFHQNDVYMPITPMFHVHAWGIPYMATFLGVKQVYPGKYIPDVLLDLIDREKVTFSHCVPTILHMLLNSPKVENINLSGWKVIIGGAALTKALTINALKKGIDIFTGYGMSETCPILSLAQLSQKDLEKDIETQADIRIKTGRPLALVELEIVDENMDKIPHDGESTGEIVVRSPWLTEGYLKDQKNSENLWHGGYLHTGDIAHCDESGFFKITDREKDIIKVGGEWISSLELEDIINQHQSVEEVAVIALLDEKWGERPLALVVLKDGDEKMVEKEILAHTKEFIKKGIMARESMLLKIHFVDSIDKTSVGKINKKKLREKYKNL